MPNVPAAAIPWSHSPHAGCEGRSKFPGRWADVGQVQIIRACLTHKNVIAVLGRSSGKTALCPMLAYEEGRQHKGFYNLAYCSPTKKLARSMYRAWKKIFGAFIDQAWDTELIIRLKPFGKNSGAQFDFWGLEEHDNLRGARLDRAIVDERKDVSKEAVSDTLAGMLLGREGKFLIIGTPKRIGRGARAFKQEYLMGQDPDRQRDGSWISFNAPSFCNPFLGDEEIQDLIDRCIDEDTVREEIYAEFLDDDAAVFSNLKRVFDIKEWRTFRLELSNGVVICSAVSERDHPNLWISEAPDQGDDEWEPDTYCAGLDLGEIHDATILSGFNRRTKRQAFILRLSRMQYPDQLPIISWLMDEYRRPFLVYDGSPHGAVVTTALAREYKKGAAARLWRTNTKIEDITQAKMLCSNTGRHADKPSWHLMDIPWQRLEMESYMVITHTKDGRALNTPRYEAPPKMHDDCVAANCIVAQAVSHPFLRKARAGDEPKKFSGRWFKKQAKKEQQLQDQLRRIYG